MPNYDKNACTECFIAILKAFTIHGEHIENIASIVQEEFHCNCELLSA